MERRQRRLLELVAHRLSEMTVGMLRFAENFQIWDYRTNISREPATLSGGESFMASLALALTLADMSAGSGEPQGALFLDEGFSALDGDCLSQAMTVLDRQTGSGRMVAITTHSVRPQSAWTRCCGPRKARPRPRCGRFRRRGAAAPGE